MTNIRFFLALLSIVLYEVLMEILHPANSLFVKMGITTLVWFSLFLSLSNFTKNYHDVKTDMPKFGFAIFLMIITWNLFNIAKSAILHDGTLLTLLGNPETSLALLVPFSLSFYQSNLNFKTLNNFLSALIIVALPAYSVYYIISGGSRDLYSNSAFLLLIGGTNFLIILLYFQSLKKRIIIIIGSMLLFYVAYVTEYRIANARILLLFMVLLIFLMIKNINKRIILYPALFSLIIPFYLLVQTLKGADSPFEKYSPEQADEILTTDTRTFLYAEVLDDLIINDCLYFGKGSNGSYYSPYFDQYGGDTEKRLSVEVGVLALLLKGGLIAVVLNFILLITAIFYSFFRANNDFVICIGLMLILHILILFITNYLDYSLYNVLLWYFIGISLSKRIRNYNNNEIKQLLFNE